jgi:hypothetical protein
MSGVIYILCAATSLVCAGLLWRGWRRSGARLLLWSALCFAGLCLNNILLVMAMRATDSPALSAWRTAPALIGVGFLLYGLIWDADRR